MQNRNITFFLLPKQDVVYLTSDYSVRQALEKMEHHRYSAVPVIDGKGKYLYTVTEGDLLWELKKRGFPSAMELSEITLTDVPCLCENRPVGINSNVDDLINLTVNQNFVPVVDDGNRFIGIVRRRDIMEFCYKAINGQKPV